MARAPHSLSYCAKLPLPMGLYCLAPTHQIQDNTPTENVLAMYEAAKRYGRYGH